jgi:adenine-specific DNA-methyltransferase
MTGKKNANRTPARPQPGPVAEGDNAAPPPSAKEAQAASCPEANEIPSTTPDFRTELAGKLAELVPEAIVDGKVDVAKLTELLAEDAGSESERFGLFWPGKRRALKAAQEPTTATLKPCPELSKDWDVTNNVFIEGDNLEVLKVLQRHYHGKIKLIYIDPPYNTGKDFVYPDNYKEGLQTYLEFTRQVDEGGRKLSTNSESEGRYHSNWLNMMYPRLKLARNLLAQDGVLCVSIDDHESENLKRLLVEAFGEDNFQAQLIWDKQHSQQQGLFKRYHEYVMVVTRDSRSIGPITGGDGEIDAGALKKVSRANPASDFTFPAGVRFEAPDGTTITGGYGDSERVEVVRGRLVSHDRKTAEQVTLRAGWTQKNQMSSWFSGSETLDSKGQRVLEFYFTGTGKLKCRKQRNVVTPPSILPRYGMVSTQTGALTDLMGGNYFDTPKPVDLIRDLARWFTSGDDVVMDFFSGSATTAHSVMLLNAEDGQARRHIQIQLPEPCPEESDAQADGYKSIADLARKRIDLAGDKIKSQQLDEQLTPRSEPLDIGYRTYKLVDTNFTKWRVASDVESDALEQHLLDFRDSSDDAATPDDLLTEILLKQGHSLSERVESVDVAGLDARSVGDNLLLAYLDEHTKPTLEQLRALVDAAEAKIVILEDAFQGDDELKTNVVQLCKTKNVALWTA